MRKWIRWLGIIFLVLMLFLAGIFFWSWKSPAYYEVKRNPTTIDSIIPFHLYTTDHPHPFVIRQSNLVVFGSQHTRDPSDPELREMEERFQKLKPTLALVEGRLGFLLPGLMDPVRNLGEGGKVKSLAQQSGIPVYNWDLSKEALAVELLKFYSAEQVALAQVLNSYFSQLRFGKPADPGAYLSDYFKRASYVGQQDNLNSIEDLDRLWRKYFPGEKDWRETSDETTLPGFLEDMMITTNDLRNRHLVNVIRELQSKGETVFVQCGSSHAFCIAPSFSSQ